MINTILHGGFILKTYHTFLLLLVFVLLLTSCAVSPTIEQDDLISQRITIQQEIRQSRILHDQALEQLRETHPEACTLYDQARIAESQGQLDIAIETYHKAMQQVPENGLLLTGLGMAYLRNEDIVPARRYLIKAVRFDPDYYKSHLGLGYIYLQNRQFPKAISQLEASLQLLPTTQGTFLLGEAEEEQGNLLRARELYQVVVQVDKNGKLGQVAATRLRSLSK
ncbi:MAG: tetratricopeptide repeat protein [Desulfuromusa sp.]|nr:tetratricopeptide repeat protein [Desulfuromusa sp.]